MPNADRLNTGGAYLAGLYDGSPYISGEQPAPGVIKLNTNENPYPPAPGVLEALAAVGERVLRLYPKQDGGILREALAAYHGLSAENIFVGNGSDEVLALAFRACFCFGRERPVLFSDVTYSFYSVWCEFFGIPFQTVSLREDFHPKAADYAHENGGIVICDPNAPTGITSGTAFLQEILAANRASSVVIVDEAYADFSESSAVSLVPHVPNLLVARSFSKSRSLAGLRIGYAAGDARLIAALMAAKDSYNSYPVDAVAAVAGVAALADEAYYRKICAKICETREHVAARLRTLGFDVPASSANFLFVGCRSAARARAIFEYLRAQGVYVRYFDKPRIDDRLRISIGTPAEMDALLAQMEAYLAL